MLYSTGYYSTVHDTTLEFSVLNSIKMETTSFCTQVSIGYYITSVQYYAVHVTIVEYPVLNSIIMETT